MSSDTSRTRPRDRVAQRDRPAALQQDQRGSGILGDLGQPNLSLLVEDPANRNPVPTASTYPPPTAGATVPICR